MIVNSKRKGLFFFPSFAKKKKNKKEIESPMLFQKEFAMECPFSQAAINAMPAHLPAVDKYAYCWELAWHL